MNKRKAVSKKLRFEVLKRDSFTCQYCGKAAPDVVLHVDHMKPVIKGGENNILNLITSCKDCNFGKGKIELSDNTVLYKQKEQLDELNEKREQLELMIKWRESLFNLKDKAVDAANDHWEKLSGHGANTIGKRNIKSLIRKYGLPEVYDSMDISAETYLDEDFDGIVTDESWEKAFKKISGICYVRSLSEKDREEYKRIGQIKKILYKNMGYINAALATEKIKSYLKSGNSFDILIQRTLDFRNFDNWCSEVGKMSNG